MNFKLNKEKEQINELCLDFQSIQEGLNNPVSLTHKEMSQILLKADPDFELGKEILDEDKYYKTQGYLDADNNIVIYQDVGNNWCDVIFVGSKNMEVSELLNKFKSYEDYELKTEIELEL